MSNPCPYLILAHVLSFSKADFSPLFYSSFDLCNAFSYLLLHTKYCGFHGNYQRAIINPKKLDTICKKVEFFSPDKKLIEVLKYMRDYDFSQVVISENGVLSLLTIEGIAKWLEQQANQEIISIIELSVRDALEYDDPKSFKLMGRWETVDAAKSAFINAIDQNQVRLFAIIVTENGKQRESPLGIVTAWDLIEHS